MIHIVMDDEFKEVFEKVLSCLIPNQSQEFNLNMFTSLLKELQKLVKVNDLYGEWYIIYKMIINMNLIRTYNSDYIPKLKIELVQDRMETEIDSYITDKQVNMQRVMDEVGEVFDPNIESNFENACNILYTRVLELYNRLEESTLNMCEDGFNLLQILETITKKNLLAQSINAQAQIMNDKLWLDGKLYKGVKGAEEFSKDFKSDYDSRFNKFMNKTKGEYSIIDLASSKKFREDHGMDIKEIYRFGYEPLDDAISICNSDVVTVIGDEGVGKTNFAVDQAVKCLTSGRDVFFMTGESSLSKIRYMVLARFLWEVYDLQMTWKEILQYEDLTEEVQSIVDEAELRMVEDPSIGKLHLIKQFAYETVYTEIKDKVTEFPNIGLVIIDHANRLASTGDLTSQGRLTTSKMRVDYLYESLVDISDEYDLAVMVLSHSSTLANQATSKDKKIGVRAGATSSATSKDADIVLYLRKNDLLKSKGMIKVEILKVREGDDAIRSFLLKRVGACSGFIYDPSEQIETEDDFDESTLSDM